MLPQLRARVRHGKRPDRRAAAGAGAAGRPCVRQRGLADWLQELLPADTKDGCVDGWPLQLPARRDGAAILAVPQTALELGGSGTPFRILRIIPDAGHAILLLQPEGAAAGSPVLRAECDAAGTYAAGQTLPVSFREEKLLFFWGAGQNFRILL